MLTRVIEVRVDVIGDFLYIFLHESSVGIFHLQPLRHDATLMLGPLYSIVCPCITLGDVAVLMLLLVFVVVAIVVAVNVVVVVALLLLFACCLLCAEACCAAVFCPAVLL